MPTEPVSEDLTAKTPQQELTIARPISAAGQPVFLRFSHRHMFSIPNFDTPYNIVTQNTSGGGVAIRYQYRCLPVKSAMFWMTPGELSLLFQFQGIKWINADFSMHNMSFRSQFVTGSTTVGFANSNMQLHGLLFEATDGNFPPYNIWKATDAPYTNNAVKGVDILNTQWSRTVDVGVTGLNVSSMQFVQLPYVPWMFAGRNCSTIAEAQPQYSKWQDIVYQHGLQLAQSSEIIGHKVNEIKRSYDLRTAWRDRFVPVKPHLSLGAEPQNFSNTPGSNTAGGLGTYGGLLYADGNAAVPGTISTHLDTTVIPPNSQFEFDEANISDYNVPIGNVPSHVAVGDYIKNERRTPQMLTPFIGIEHLPNADGSIVQSLWDFYLDTDIIVEATYNTGVFQQASIITTTFDGTPGVSEKQQFVTSQPSPYNATMSKKNDMIRTAVVAHMNGTMAGYNDFGSGSGFGAKGAFGEMVPATTFRDGTI